ncbi:MAG: hypothetical protein WCS34_09360 [Bacteroidales bacterium]
MKKILNIILVAFGVFLLASCADKSIDYTWKDVVTFEKASYSIYQGVESGKIKIPVVYNGNDKNADYKVSFNVLPDGAEAGVNYDLDESDISGTLTLSYDHPTDTIDFNIYNVDGNVANLDFKVAINKSDDFKIPVDTTTVTVIGHPLYMLLGSWLMDLNMIPSISNVWYGTYYALSAFGAEYAIVNVSPYEGDLEKLVVNNIAWWGANFVGTPIYSGDEVVGLTLELGQEYTDSEGNISILAKYNEDGSLTTDGTFDLALSSDNLTLANTNTESVAVVDETGSVINILYLTTSAPSYSMVKQ